MPLFDDMVRTETRAKRQNESTFEYLNTSARPGIAAARALLESWFEHLPEAAKNDIRGRFRSRDEIPHQSAFFELLWHEMLYRAGYQVEIHPPVPGVTTNPDFLARRDGLPQFYLEVTLAMPPQVNAGADRRLAELQDVLDRMDSPDFFIEVQYRGMPQDNIRGRALRDRLERWLQQLDYDEIAQLYRHQNYAAVPSLTVTEQSATLTFTPIPKSPESRGKPGARPVGVVMPLNIREVRVHDDIRAAVEGKADKYGELNLPLVVAVNVMDDFFEDYDMLNALFGEEQVVAVQRPDGTWEHRWNTRVPNGAWQGREGPRKTLVSAVVVSHRLSPTTLRHRPLGLIHNPWAMNPLLLRALPIPERSVSIPDGHITTHAGTSAPDFLGVPDPWPPPDAAR